MSTNPVHALKNNKSYLQSPIDDIESFFWVLLYSIVHNAASRLQCDDLLRGVYDTEGRAEALQIFHFVGVDTEYSELTRSLSESGLLGVYEAANRTMQVRWQRDCNAVRTQADPPDAHAWELCYHATAIDGLLAVLQILMSFKDRTPSDTDTEDNLFA